MCINGVDACCLYLQKEYIVVAPTRGWDPTVVSDPVAAARKVSSDELEDDKLLRLLLQKRDEELNILAWCACGHGWSEDWDVVQGWTQLRRYWGEPQSGTLVAQRRMTKGRWHNDSVDGASVFHRAVHTVLVETRRGLRQDCFDVPGTAYTPLLPVAVALK